MPKNSNKQIKRLEGEAQGSFMAKCKNDELRTFHNQRGLDMWKKLHNKKCDCLKNVGKVEDYVINLSTTEEVRKNGRFGSVSRNEQDFLNMFNE